MMRSAPRFHKKRSVKSGLPPGTLVHIGNESSEAVQISVIGYGPDGIEERHFEQIDRYLDNPCDGAVVWVDVEGVHDVELIRALGERHTFHPLVLEDIVNTVQRPKIEDYGDYLFIVLRMLCPTEDGEFQFGTAQHHSRARTICSPSRRGSRVMPSTRFVTVSGAAREKFAAWGPIIWPTP